jgi:periplasmic protein CpxP/Spy
MTATRVSIEGKTSSKVKCDQEEAVKFRIVTIASIAVLALGTIAGVAFAQGPGARGMHRGFMGGPEFGMFLHQLNLTPDQKTQVKQIFQNEKPNIKPIMQQEVQYHQSMIQLITSGNFDQAKATALATQEAQAHIQMEVEHAKIGAQIYNLLDSTQKSKVADIIAQHQQRMQQHMQNQGQTASPDQQ